MRLPLSLFGFYGADNRAAPLSSAAFAALPSSAQSTLFCSVPQAHVASDAYSPTYPPAEQYANFSSGPIDTDLGSLGLEWNGNLLDELTASPHRTTSYDGAYLSTAGPSSFNTYALPDVTEPKPAYYSPNHSAATSTIDDIEDGAYLSTPGPSSFNKLATYALPDATEPEPAYYPPVYPPATSSIGDVECGFNTYLPESANPSFLSNRSAWLSPAPEELSQPEECPIPEGTACPEDCFDFTDLPLTPPAPLYDSPLQMLYNTSPSTASYDMSPPTATYNFSPSTASYDTSPSTAFFDGNLSEQYLPLYSPAATSVDSCSPTWASRAQPVLPPTRIAYNSSPSTASYNSSLSAASYDSSPSAASFDSTFFEQHPALYSPAAASVDSCSPTWASKAQPVLPPTRTGYNSSPSTASYDTSPSTASYDNSPSTTSFDDSLLGQYRGPYSPVATSVDSCSPTWPSSAEPVMLPSQTGYNVSPSTASYDTSPSTASFDGSHFKQDFVPYSPVTTSLDSCLPGPSSAKPVMLPNHMAYDISPSTASYDTSPSTTCFDGSLLEQYRGPYSPVTTPVDSCSPPSSAKPVQPPSDTSLGRPISYAVTGASSWPVGSSSKRRYEDDDGLEMPRTKRIKEVGGYQGLVWPPPVAGSSKRRLEDDEESVDEPRMKRIKEVGEYQGLVWPPPVAGSSKRRLEDDDVLEMPRTKRIKEVGGYQGLVWPPPVAGSFKRTLEDDEESVDEPLMKKMRKMKNKKRLARSAETQTRRVSTEALRRPQLGFVGPSRGDISTTEDRAKFSNCGVEGPEQTPSGSSSQTTQVENATPAPSEPIQAAPAPKKKLRCPQEKECGNKTGFKRPAELNRHLLSVHTVKLLKCPALGCPKWISRRDGLSRHLKKKHGWEGRTAKRTARTIEDEALAAHERRE